MFTPPPSPNPSSSSACFPSMLPTIDHSHFSDHTTPRGLGLDPSPTPASYPGTPIEDPDPEQKKKKSVGRQTKWTVLLVPVVLVAVTASTRYLAHPAAFDLFAGGPERVSWKSAADLGRVHQRHSHGGRAGRAKREEAWAGGEPASTTSSGGGSNTGSGGIATGTPATGTVATGTVATGTVATGTMATGTQAGTGTGTGTVAQSSTASTTTPVNIQPLPTVPSTPPVLPTPFPQPLSAGIPTDNMSISCVAFFNNMTNSLPFRQCRAFSLLLQSSDDVIQAETNMTQLNTIVWGTCNATPGKDQCVKNMGWFADQLQSACPRELQDGLQPIASDTLIALDAYSLMYDAACTLTDPTTNSYCFLNAAHNSNPSDLYLYQLPIGNAYPSSAMPTCSTCSKSLLSLYWDALHNSSTSNDLKTLASTYNTGAKAVDTVCRSNFATVLNFGARRFAPPSSLVMNLSLVVLGFWLAWTCL